MFKYLKNQRDIDLEEIGIILDNWSWYRAKLVIAYWEKKKTNLLFIPPYWPELVPLEVYFSKLKKEFIKVDRAQSYNLKNEAWIKGIKRCIFNMSQAFIKRLWFSLLNIVNSNLDVLYHLDQIYFLLNCYYLL